MKRIYTSIALLMIVGLFEKDALAQIPPSSVENDAHHSAAFNNESVDDAHMGYDLMQPEESPQYDMDFALGRYGQSEIYDIDGDGDNDFLFIAQHPGGYSRVIPYLNDGQGNYNRIELLEPITFEPAQIMPNAYLEIKKLPPGLSTPNL